MIVAHRRQWLVAVLVTAWCWGSDGTIVAADSGLTQTALESRLAAQHLSRFSNVTLRDTLDELSRATDVTYWLDRRVDASQVIEVARAGPTVEQAFVEVAAAAELVVLPIDHLILVGRAEWVDRTGSLILLAGTGATIPADGVIKLAGSTRWRGAAKRVGWPYLRTPNEALREVARVGRLDVSAVDLPHDLWPALRETSLRPTTAVTLIGCAFDRWLRIDASRRVTATELPAKWVFDRTYESDRVRARLEGIRQADPAARLVREGSKLQVRASLRTHRRLAAVPQRPKPSLSTARYTLNFQNAPAGAALQSLANAGGWTLDLRGDAVVDACRERVDVAGTDETLEVLVRRVAQAAGVAVRWDADRLVVEMAAVPAR